MTAADLLELLIARLVRDCGGTRRQWRAAIGLVKIYSVATHPHCNWAVSPSGSLYQCAEIEQRVDDLRQHYPIIR